MPTATPTFGARPSPKIDEYYRLEIFTQTGSEGYDIFGISRDHIIEDVLDRFVAYVRFLNYTAEMLIPPAITVIPA